jgi:hypothetical protein
MPRLLLIALATVLLGSSAAAAEPRRLVIVVAKTSPVTNISRQDLQRLYLGEPIVVASVRLVPFNALPNSRDRDDFDRVELSMSPEEAGRFWIDRKVRGQGTAPRALPPVHVANVVAKFPGAISYMPVDKLTSDIKPITVDGIAYDEDRYPLVVR